MFIILSILSNGITFSVKVKRPARGLEWPRGFQEVKVPRFLDNGTR
jgi:hypothetical protein